MNVLTRTLLSCLLILASSALFANEIREGVDFYVIDTPQPTADPSRVEVLEVFAYGCPACNAFKPHMDAYERDLPEGVYVERLAAPFGGFSEMMARVYFTLDTMGQVDQVHSEIYDAIHNQRKRWRNIEQVAAHLANHGIDRDQLLRTAQSFAVESRMRRAMQHLQRTGVDATPNVIVNGKYRVVARSGSGFGHKIRVIEHLVERELAELETNQATDDEYASR